jgi:hypothetical protein
LKRWEENGTWQRLIHALLAAKEAEMAQVALDTSLIKAKKGAHAWDKPTAAKPPNAA